MDRGCPFPQPMGSLRERRKLRPPAGFGTEPMPQTILGRFAVLGAILDMSINAKKSCCIRVGQHFCVKCKDINSLNGQTLPWVKEMKYLGVYFIQARSFCCSLDHAKHFLPRNAL